MRTEVSRFALIQASTVDDAVSKLTKYGGTAVVIAGGTDVVLRNKSKIATMMPSYLIDISGLNLSYLNYDPSGGFHIGATTPVSTVASDANVNSVVPALAQAASAVATPQIQNQATIAGDILQEVWCPYFRNNFQCWRNGGNMCYGVDGDNRYYHSLFGGNLCYGVHASDISTALSALDADVTVAGSSGTRTVSMDQLLQGVTIVDGRVKENSLRYNELVTEVHIPAPAPGTVSAFYKVQERGGFDFALASAAVVLSLSGNTISKARVVLGGVANKPYRASSAESYLVGQQLGETVYAEAATKALSGATPLTTGVGNAFRVFVAQGALKAALRSLA